ncbi:MAG: O-antigen ligase family protein [bacterium]|nr:O-antigen ligase family protein [bacterium]
MSEIELSHRHPIQRFSGWAGLALICVLVGVTFTYFAYTYRFIIGLLASAALIAPVVLFLVFAHEKARLWWARIMVALMPLGLLFRLGNDEFYITPALFMFLINLFVIVLDKLQGYEGEKPKPTPLAKPLGIWLFTIVFSTVVSRYAVHGLLDLIPLLLASTVYVYVRLYIRDERELESLIKAFTVGACFSLGSGYFELAKGVTYTADLSHESQSVTMYSDVFRVDGSFYGPNSFVYFSASCALLYSVMFFYWRNWRWKIFSLVLAISGAVLSIFTYSRSGVVGLAAGMGFLILALVPPKKRRKLYLILIPLALAVAAGVLIPVMGAQSRGTGLVDPQELQQSTVTADSAGQVADVISSLARPIMWYWSFEFWKTSPIWGIGHSNFEGYFNLVMPDMFRMFGFYPRHPHNIFIYALLSTGLIGLGCLIVILVKLVKFTFSGIRHRGTFIGYLSIALASIWLLTFIQGMVDAVFVLPLTLPLAGFFFFFLASSTFVMDAVKERHAREKMGPSSLPADGSSPSGMDEPSG